MLLRCLLVSLALGMLATDSAFAQIEPRPGVWEEFDINGLNGPGLIDTAPSCVSRMPARIDCFARNRMDDALNHTQWNGSEWTPWESVGGVLAGRPECVSWGAYRIDCFVRGSDNAMHHTWWEGYPPGQGGVSVGVANLQVGDTLFWRGWESLGGSFDSEIDCVSWDVGRIDCFVIGTDNALWHRWWDGSQWRDWENLGGQFTDPRTRPECVSWSAFRIDCLVLTNGGRMQHLWWDVTQWRGWEDLGGSFMGNISCVSHAPNRIDCFGRGHVSGQGTGAHDWAMSTRSWNGSQWIGGDLQGYVDSPECVSWGPGRIDCFALGPGGVYHLWWDGLQWRDWRWLGGDNGPLSCTTWRVGRIDCFQTSNYYRLQHKWWDGERWRPGAGSPRAPERTVSPWMAPSPRQAPQRPPRVRE